MPPATDSSRRPWWRTLASGIVTGAANADPSAIATFVSAGAAFGAAVLWVAPVCFPLMVAVIYLCAKLGKVAGRGLFGVLRHESPPWLGRALLLVTLPGYLVGAAADLGGMAEALGFLVPWPRPWIALLLGAAVLTLQILATYETLRAIFRWAALALLAYAVAALLARPNLAEVLRGTLVPTLRLDANFLSLLVAMMGASLSAYIYSWQTNQEVQEGIAAGKHTAEDRQGATRAELRESRADVASGMFFSAFILYFVTLAAASTLHRSGQTEIGSATDAALALRPAAGSAAQWLFALGIVAGGFLAVPVMTTGAANDLCQTFGWRHGLHAKAREARRFYLVISAVTALAVALNFTGVNPFRALVWSGIVQGFSAPVLLALILWLTNRRGVLGDKVNTWRVNLVGGVALLMLLAAAISLLVGWLSVRV